MGMTFNPMAVMMKQPGKTGVPYLGDGSAPSGWGSNPPRGPMPVWGGKPPMAGGGQPFTDNGGSGSQAATPSAPNVVGPESVRATGTGPFDQAYRQDLATYAGGLFARPGGNLSFNPTSNQPFGGAAVGGGSAPVFGMPNTLLQNALGGNPFSFTPPLPAQGATNNQPGTQQMQDWLNQLLGQGRNQRLAMA